MKLLRRITNRWTMGLGMVALVGLGYYVGRMDSDTPLAAEPRTSNAPAVAPPNAPRAIAYLHKNVPITREEFGDYFISLYGAERVELFVNRRIIEIAAAKKGIEITPQEIDAQILEDCKRIGVEKADFIRTVLRDRYKKTIEEWRMDVIRPRLMLSKMCRDRIQVTDDELKKVFENLYGKKVRCKIIIWPKDDETRALKEYGTIRNSDKEFDAVAVRQKDGTLAASAGEVAPIGRHSGKHSDKIEEIAFGLEVGQLSPVTPTPFGVMVIKCIGHIEPVKGVEFEKVKPELMKEVIDRKLEFEIPKYFTEMKKEAGAVILLPQKNVTEEAIQKATGVSPKGDVQP